ncbi:MAG: GNAT family N-acetyltransferase [Pirellulales bacterium]|nr:GNAT family N-acetyltransferase [Pirellulales bacterium]
MPPASHETAGVHWETTLAEAETLDAQPELVANFNHFQRYSTSATELSWAVLRRSGQLVAAAPVVRLRRRSVTDLLQTAWRRRLGWLAPVLRKTTLLVDTAFLAFDPASPFLVAPEEDRLAAKQTIADFLCRQKKVDTVWIAEPPAEATWAAGGKFDQFHTLPMVAIDLAGSDSFDAYLATLSKKRRRNYRHESEAFAAVGATIEVVEGPLAARPELLAALVDCLRASEARSDLSVPFNDVLISPQAFAAQPQTALVARVGDRAVGFMSFLQAGDRWMQVHGGLDYSLSLEAYAYHNLIYAAVREAIARGCRAVTMGPLNNETKRRAGTDLSPIVASVWNRFPVDRIVARGWLFPRLAIYQGPLSDGSTAAAPRGV